jgi:hypothetical protein
MKYKNYILLLAVVSTSLFACKDDDEEIEPVKNQYMLATINGTPTEFPKCDADTFGYFGTEFEISGYYNLFALQPAVKSELELIVYQSDYTIKTDTFYSLDSASMIQGYYTSDFNGYTDTSVYYSTSGQVKFTKAGVNGYEGTFNFKATRANNSKTISINNGVFKAILKKE